MLLSCYADSEGRSMKLPQGFSSMTLTDTQGVVRCMVSEYMAHVSTHRHRQRQELTSKLYNTLHHQNY